MLAERFRYLSMQCQDYNIMRQIQGIRPCGPKTQGLGKTVEL
jgi:hypothetical protein